MDEIGNVALGMPALLANLLNPLDDVFVKLCLHAKKDGKLLQNNRKCLSSLSLLVSNTARDNITGHEKFGEKIGVGLQIR